MSSERFDALIQMITAQVQGDTSEKVAAMNRLGTDQYDDLAAKERLLEELLTVVRRQKDRLSAYAPKAEVPQNPMPRIVQKGPNNAG